MRSLTKAALVAVTLACGTFTASIPAQAVDNITVGIGPAGIVFGYTDGYWDSSRRWHRWENRRAFERFKSEHQDRYFDRPQTRDRRDGLREDDKWWDRGGIAFGYSNGYWDNEGRWHKWQNQQAARQFSAEHRDKYFDRPQTRDRRDGVREDDKWWDRR